MNCGQPHARLSVVHRQASIQGATTQT